jgi:hypothetical protein
MNRRDALSRALLAGASGAWVALAGCSTDGSTGESDGADGEPTSSSTGTEATATDGGEAGGASRTSSEPRSDGGLDLREANVTDVAVEQQDGRRFRFDVTLHHDDDGEDGYANWWQVETRDGEQLGRRELLHAHGTREFTRSETIEVPEGVDCVVVRGHDQTHEYGGQAALVRVSTGAVRFVEQGLERVSLADEDCP